MLATSGSSAAPRLVPRTTRSWLDSLEPFGAINSGGGLRPFPGVEPEIRQDRIWVRSPDRCQEYLDPAAPGPLRRDATGWCSVGADDGRVCPDGGAIALGHPWGASGALLVVRLFGSPPGPTRGARGLGGTGSTRGAAAATTDRYGVATCAIGGGQGIAVLVEAVPAGRAG